MKFDFNLGGIVGILFGIWLALGILVYFGADFTGVFN